MGNDLSNIPSVQHFGEESYLNFTTSPKSNMRGFQFQLPALGKKSVVPKVFNMEDKSGIFWSPKQSVGTTVRFKQSSALRTDLSPGKKSMLLSPKK